MGDTHSCTYNGYANFPCEIYVKYKESKAAQGINVLPIEEDKGIHRCLAAVNSDQPNLEKKCLAIKLLNNEDLNGSINPPIFVPTKDLYEDS